MSPNSYIMDTVHWPSIQNISGSIPNITTVIKWKKFVSVRRTNCLKTKTQLTSKWYAYQICFRQWKISYITLMTSTASH